MSDYGNFEREQMRRAVEEMEEREESGFEQFMILVFKCVAIILAGACGMFLLNWLEHFGRNP